jgi:hypothetical protein
MTTDPTTIKIKLISRDEELDLALASKALDEATDATRVAYAAFVKNPNKENSIAHADAVDAWEDAGKAWSAAMKSKKS